MTHDWEALERPQYTLARVVRYWCALPDSHKMLLDRRTLLPLPDPAHPLVEVRTLILQDALGRGYLPYVVTDPDWHEQREGPAPWRIREVRHDDLKRWFTAYRAPERPAFLFWREDSATTPGMGGQPPDTQPEPLNVPAGEETPDTATESGVMDRREARLRAWLEEQQIPESEWHNLGARGHTRLSVYRAMKGYSEFRSNHGWGAPVKQSSFERFFWKEQKIASIKEG